MRPRAEEPRPLAARYEATDGVVYVLKADKAKGVQADQIIELHGYYARKDYPDRLRRADHR